jgi:hypothetical protein
MANKTKQKVLWVSLPYLSQLYNGGGDDEVPQALESRRSQMECGIWGTSTVTTIKKSKEGTSWEGSSLEEVDEGFIRLEMLTLRSATLVDISTKPNGKFHSLKIITLFYSSAMLRVSCIYYTQCRANYATTGWTDTLDSCRETEVVIRLPSRSHQYRNVWFRLNGEILSVRGTWDQSRLRGIAVLPSFNCGGSYFRLGQKTAI